MCMLAEILAISLFMIYIVVCMILSYSIADRLIKKYPEQSDRIILGSFIAFIFAIALLVGISLHGYIYTYIEKVAKFMLGV